MKLTKDNVLFFGTAIPDEHRPAIVKHVNKLIENHPDLAGTPFELDCDGVKYTGYVTFQTNDANVDVQATEISATAEPQATEAEKTADAPKAENVKKPTKPKAVRPRKR